MGRRDKPEERTGPLLLLTSDAGRFITTGACLAVDGGWAAR